MIYKANQKQVEEYFQSTHMSQSNLKLLMYNPKKFKEKEDEEEDPYSEESAALRIGSAVDLALTGLPQDFDKVFYVDDLEKKPSDTIIKFCKMLYENHTVGELADYSNEIIELCDQENYRKNWGDDAKVNNVIKEGTDYWNSLKASAGKSILTLAEKQIVDQTVMSLSSHPNTAKEFQNGGLFEDIVFQFPVYFETEGIACKALIDIVRVDHETKKIYLSDIKTTSDHVLSFNKAVKRFRYDFQAAFYIEAISRSREALEKLIGRSTEGYSVAGFSWIVESVKYPGNPVVISATPDLINVGRHGRDEIFVKGQNDTKGMMYSPRIKGWLNAMHDYKWYYENGFDTPRVIARNKGKLTMNQYGIEELAMS